MSLLLPFEVIPTEFTLYKLSPDAEREAYTYNNAQLAALSNEVTMLSQRKLALKYDPSNPNVFLQQEAFITGQIASLKFLLDTHAAYNTPEQVN